MARGGKREKAGRKPGSVGKRKQLLSRISDEAIMVGLKPLEYLLQVMRGEVTADKDKLAAAVAAAPFIHPKLSAIEANITANIKRDVDDYTDDELATIACTGRADHAAAPSGPKVSN